MKDVPHDMMTSKVDALVDSMGVTLKKSPLHTDVETWIRYNT